MNAVRPVVPGNLLLAEGAETDSAHEYLLALLHVLVPGNNAVAVIQAYFDESGTHDGSPAMCVAGYIYDGKRCADMDVKWRSVLSRYGLPYFHMVDCAHGAKPFDRLSSEERADVEKEIIGLITGHAICGQYAVACEPIYDGIMHPLGMGSAYTFCCFMALEGVAQWCNRSGFNGSVAYFFESGHKYQAQSNSLMNGIAKSDKMRTKFRYGSHTFADKCNIRPLQSADVLAWHAITDIKRRLRGDEKWRRDFEELLKIETYHFFITSQMMNDFREESLL